MFVETKMIRLTATTNSRLKLPCWAGRQCLPVPCSKTSNNLTLESDMSNICT